MIKAFLFDYDGVITKGVENERVARTLAANLDIPVAQAANLCSDIWPLYIKGQLSEAQVWERLEKSYGKGIPSSLRDIWFPWEELQPLPEMVAVVRSLKANDFAVGILSNAFKETMQIIETNGGYQDFDFKVISCEVGYKKPEPDIFHLALEKLPGTSPEEVVFLDDREANAAAASELGLQSIYVTDHHSAIEKIKRFARLE